MNTMGRGLRAAIALTLVLLVTPHDPAVATHVDGTRFHADLAISSISTVGIVSGRTNTVTVIVEDRGPEGASGTVSLYYDGVHPSTLIGQEPVVFETPTTMSVDFETNGESASGVDMTHAQTLLAIVEVRPGIEDEVASNNQYTRPIQVLQYGVASSLSSSPTFDQRATYLAPARYAFQVTNTGNAADTIRLAVGASNESVADPVTDGGQEPLLGWTYTFEQPSMALAPGEKRGNALLVRPGADAERGAWSIIAVIATSEGNPDVFARRNAPNTSVARLDDVSILEATGGEGAPGDFVQVHFTVRNRGNGADTFRLGHLPLPAGWSASFADTSSLNHITIPAGEFRNLRALVRLPAEGRASNEIITLTATSTAPDGTGSSDQRSTTVRLAQRFALRLEPISSLQTSTDPHEAAQVRLRLINDGNGPDVIGLAFDNLPPGWTTTFDQTRTSLPAGGSAEILSSVVPPAGERTGTFDLNLRATSELAPATIVTQRVTVEVRAAYGVVLQSLPRVGFTPGERRSVDLHVQNAGNLDDDIELTLVPPAAASGWTASLTGTGPTTQAVFSLAAGASQLVSVHVEAPDNLTVGTTMPFLFFGNSTGSGGLKVDQLLVNGTARAADLVPQSVVATPATAYAGQAVSLVARVANVGDLAVAQPFDATVQLRRLLPGGALQDPPILVKPVVQVDAPLAAGEHRNITITVPTIGLDGQYRASIILDKNAKIAELFDEIHGPSNNVLNLTLAVRRAQVAVVAPIPATAGSGESVSFVNLQAFRVRNLGSAAERFDLTAAVDGAWNVQVLPSTLLLGPGDEAPVVVEVDIPDLLAGRDAANVTVTATLVDFTAVTHANQTVLRIADATPPLIAGLVVDAGPQMAGTPVAFRADIADNLAVHTATLVVRRPDAREVRVPLNATALPGVYATQATFPVAGTYRAHVEAADRAGNMATTAATPASFILGSGGSVVVQPSGWVDAAKVRTGAKLNVSILSPEGVAEALYYVDGVARLFATPSADLYGIDTAGLQDGPHQLRVVGRSNTGAEHALNASITLDSAPPIISGVQLLPERPLPGDTVQVLVRVASDDVAAVFVELQRGIAEPSRYAALPTEEGAWSSSFVVQVAFDDVVVEAIDDVGNNLRVTPGELLVLLEEPNADGGTPWPLIAGIGGVALAAAAIVSLLVSRTLGRRGRAGGDSDGAS